MSNPKPIPLHTWQLVHRTLQPTACHMQSYTILLATQSHPDPLITFAFPNEPDKPSIPIHTSHLRSASPAFDALISGPFLESQSRNIELHHETHQAFSVIRSFLYLQTINMENLPPDIHIVADRWGLDLLYAACFAYAETRSWNGTDTFMQFCLPTMRYLRVPDTFKRVFAIRMAAALPDIQLWLRGSDHETLTSLGNNATCSHQIQAHDKDKAHNRQQASTLSEHTPVNETPDGTERGEKRPTDSPPTSFDPKRPRVESLSATHSPEGSAQSHASGDHENISAESKMPDKPPNTPSASTIAEDDASKDTTPERVLQLPAPELPDPVELKEREEALWDALLVQDLIPQLITHLNFYRPKKYAEFVLDGIFRVLKDKLGDKEVTALLARISWSSKPVADLLDENFVSSWGEREWKLIVRAQTFAAMAKEGGNDEFSLVMRWDGLSGDILNHSDSLFGKCEYNEFTRWKFLEVWMSGRTREVREGEFEPLFLALEVGALEEYIEDDDLDRIVRVSVRVMETDCACSTGRDLNLKPQPFFTEFGARTVASLTESARVQYLVMSEDEVGRWVQRHQPWCGLAFQVCVRVSAKIPSLERLDIDTYDIIWQTRLSGRGVCPCGNCAGAGDEAVPRRGSDEEAEDGNDDHNDTHHDDSSDESTDEEDDAGTVGSDSNSYNEEGSSDFIPEIGDIPPQELNEESVDDGG